ncbi:hypothetical protein PSECIP111951_00064 [Pseudoalteromonas holothuriae]|uniref:Uncharacterized protein n=1 Tax=Pseudoalteromonas holothuriae TaxID=2963714 RepID=A0ABM9GCV5_9GAMM|nr:hypothetical protein [Pseudoalteromonas sp. CIP111951]CAH9049881.1 hypothetical protein PSECIP111951_00064 [Pseudoalteromonas sp. CIP111951]
MLKYLVALTITVTVMSVSFAKNTTKDFQKQKISNEEYRMIVFQDCQQVLVEPLNDQQLSSYLALTTLSKKMKQLEKPVDKVSAQMSRLGKQIEALSSKAFVEHDGKLTIDKTLLAKQKKISNQLSTLASNHEDDFKALETQGKKIELAANNFESLIAPLIGDIKNSHIQILKSGEPVKPCNLLSTYS